MNSTPEPAKWSFEQMPCFESFQLTMKWISNMNINQGKCVI